MSKEDPIAVVAALRDVAESCQHGKLLAVASQLHECGLMLAACGLEEAAFKVWQPVLGKELPERSPSVYGDAASTVLAHLSGRDVIREEGHWPQWEVELEAGDTLEPMEWLMRHRDWVLQRLLMSRWSDAQVATWGQEKPGTLKGDVVRLHRALDQLEQDSSGAVRELEALASEGSLPDYAKGDLWLAAASFHGDLGDLARADSALLAWAALPGSWNHLDLQAALSLPGVAQQLRGGLLTERSGVTREQAEEQVSAALQVLRARIESGEEVNPSRASYEFYPSYGTLLLEPRKPESSEALLATDEEFSAGVAVRGDRAAIFVPDLDGSLQVSLVVAAVLSESATVRFSLEVTDDVYLRSVDTPDDLLRFEVAPGTYRASAEFCETEEVLREIKIVLVRADGETGASPQSGAANPHP